VKDISNKIDAMKVALIGPVYPYRGGISHFTSMLCKSLLDQNHNVLLVSFSRQYPAWLYPGKSDRDPSPDFFKLEADYLLDPINVLSWQRTLQHVINFAPNIVVLPWWTTFWAPAFTYLANRLRNHKIPVMYLIHNVLPHEQKVWDSSLTKLALSQGDIHLAQTEQEGQKLKALIPASNLVISSHPVYEMFVNSKIPKPDAKKELGISPEQYVLLFFGIVRPYKGLETLLHAMADLSSKGIKPILVVAGEFWQDKSTLLRLIERLKLTEHVFFEDRYIPDQELPTYFSAADIFVAPYKKGTQSGAVKLALGFNLPIILSETIADNTILALTNYPVYITPPENPTELAQSIETAIENLSNEFKPANTQENGWQAIVNVIENSVLEFDQPDDQ
jgi:glycosyltransferase involved in cell wall biosynthesis